jgi:hypothetical protein
VLFIPCFYRAYLNMLPQLVHEFAAIGVMLKIRETEESCFQLTGQTRNMVPLGFGPGWEPDFPDPVGLADQLSSAAISCDRQTNFSEVGMTPARMDRCGLPRTFVTYPDHRRISIHVPPTVDADLARCEALSNDARNSCWDAFDHHVMEDIVPWVPLYWTGNEVVITGRTVVPRTVTVDQFSGLLSLAHLVVNNNAVMPA